MMKSYSSRSRASASCILVEPTSSAGFGGWGPADMNESRGASILRITSSMGRPVRKVESPTSFVTPMCGWQLACRMSASMRSTRAPDSASVAARFVEMTVFPSLMPALANMITLGGAPAVEKRMFVRNPRNASAITDIGS